MANSLKIPDLPESEEIFHGMPKTAWERIRGEAIQDTLNAQQTPQLEDLQKKLQLLNSNYQLSLQETPDGKKREYFSLLAKSKIDDNLALYRLAMNCLSEPDQAFIDALREHFASTKNFQPTYLEVLKFVFNYCRPNFQGEYKFLPLPLTIKTTDIESEKDRAECFDGLMLAVGSFIHYSDQKKLLETNISALKQNQKGLPPTIEQLDHLQAPIMTYLVRESIQAQVENVLNPRAGFNPTAILEHFNYFNDAEYIKDKIQRGRGLSKDRGWIGMKDSPYQSNLDDLRQKIPNDLPLDQIFEIITFIYKLANSPDVDNIAGLNAQLAHKLGGGLAKLLSKYDVAHKGVFYRAVLAQLNLTKGIFYNATANKKPSIAEGPSETK